MIIVAFFYIKNNLKKLEIKSKIGHKIENSASLLNSLGYEYIINFEERSLKQWNIKNQELKNNLEQYLKITSDKREIEIVTNMIKNYNNVNEYFSSILNLIQRNNFEKQSRLSKRLQSFLLLNLQYIINDGFELTKNIEIEQWKTIFNGFVMILALYVLFSSTIFLISFFINNRISKSFLSLHEGVKLVGDGNLKYQFEVYLSDEIADLANAFNIMTLKLEKFYTELERSNKELEDFAYIASHDLQEPLRKISSFSDLLKDEESKTLSDSGKDYIDRMQKSAERMSQLIEDLLSFSRVTTKAKPFQQVDLNKTLEDVLFNLEKRINDTSAKIERESLPLIEAEQSQMRQLFQNLLGNAIKFHKPDVPPVISVKSVMINENNYQITVKDNGIGFDEQYIDRIFKPFERLHGKGRYEGTGIGLAICQKIVNRHFGTITAKSSEGNGASFIITLPIKQSNTERK
ncbi:MAG: HAMP domain-containing protein [Desulfobacterales bacterium]|nr:HAMP domain-containing protein [Desulfobacterales bacterium]